MSSETDRVTPMEWPYPIRYGEIEEVVCDVLVLGGGTSGCRAAITAAKKGADVVLVEKGATIRSGSGGAGIDHWGYAADNPSSKVDPEELFRVLVETRGGYTNGIADYILCKTNYDTLLELEEMGGKVRDYNGEFKGAEFRDEETKFLFTYDYTNKTCLRVWGTTFKTAMHGELKKQEVRIYDRIMSTGLLTEGGRRGARVIGATGFNNRSGEFYVFKAKAVVLCLGFPGRNWSFSTELRGMAQVTPVQNVGDGHAMAWRAGAEFVNMERSIRGTFNSPHSFPVFGVGNHLNTWHPCTIVDANGKEIPWVDADGNIIEDVSGRSNPAPNQKFILDGTYQKDARYRAPHLIPDLQQRIAKGEFVLPFYADLPGMPEHERKAIWGIMVGEEGKTKAPIYMTYMTSGFDPNKDMLQSYHMLGGNYMTDFGGPKDRLIFFAGGGLMVDWDLRTNLEGLYGAGEQIFAIHSYPGASTSGRWAGRKAAAYAQISDQGELDKGQVAREMERVYAPIERDKGMDWKELNGGIVKIMMNYCSEPMNEELLKIGLTALKEVENEEASRLFADNPHRLMRTLEVQDVITCNQIIIHSCMARKASSDYLGFTRIDYPEKDPEEWNKFVTVRLEDGEVKVGEKPIDYYEPVKENFEAHMKD